MTNANTITLEILSKPSNSKGWGRAALASGSRNVVASNTGNEWVGGTSYSGEAAEGESLRLRLQTMLRVGKGGARPREEITTSEHALVAAPGESAEIEHREGSQGIRVRITGARVAS